MDNLGIGSRVIRSKKDIRYLGFSTDPRVYKEEQEDREFDNSSGYGFWCGKKCVQRKQDAGIKPIAERRQDKRNTKAGTKQSESELNASLAEALKTQGQTGTPAPVKSNVGAVIAMVVVSLAVVGTIGYFALRRGKTS